MKLIQSGGKWDSLLVTMMPKKSILEAGAAPPGDDRPRPPPKRRQSSDSDVERRTKMTSILHVMNVAHDVAARCGDAFRVSLTPVLSALEHEFIEVSSPLLQVAERAPAPAPDLLSLAAPAPEQPPPLPLAAASAPAPAQVNAEAELCAAPEASDVAPASVSGDDLTAALAPASAPQSEAAASALASAEVDDDATGTFAELVPIVEEVIQSENFEVRARASRTCSSVYRRGERR